MLCYAEAKASELEALIGYTFADKCLAAEAVQMEAPHIAVIMDNNFLGLNNNKRLSVLGDAVLAKELSSAWYKARDSHSRVAPRCACHSKPLTITRSSPVSGAIDCTAQRNTRKYRLG